MKTNLQIGKKYRVGIQYPEGSVIGPYKESLHFEVVGLNKRKVWMKAITSFMVLAPDSKVCFPREEVEKYAVEVDDNLKAIDGRDDGPIFKVRDE